MHFLKQLGCAAAITLAAGGAQAAPIMNDWVFNPNGGGLAKGQTINEYLDVNGNAFIQLKATSATSFEFTEHAVFNLSQADSNGRLFPLTYTGGNITATLEGHGSGTFGGSFGFTGGVIRMYQNPTNRQYGGTNGFYGANLGKQIAEFRILAGGGGKVDGKGNPLDNGQVSVVAEALPGMLAAGYFFGSDGTDLSTRAVNSFAFTNANTLGKPTGRLVNEVACQFAGYKGPGCGKGNYGNVPGSHFFIGGSGQFKLGALAEVAEPGSVALFGISLLGVAAAGRRRRQR